MARVSSTFLKPFMPMDANSLRKPIVFVVDMINGFIKEGALHDEEIFSSVKAIELLLNDLDCQSVFVADAHPFQTREFQSFPSHCIKGTSESDIVDELKSYIKTLFYKNSTNAFFAPQFQTFLQEEMPQYEDIIIVGCCSDICILQFALSLNAYFNEHNEIEKRILIPIDAIDTYHIDQVHEAITWNEFAIANMQANGIHLVCSIHRGDEYENI